LGKKVNLVFLNRDDGETELSKNNKLNNLENCWLVEHYVPHLAVLTDLLLKSRMISKWSIILR